MGSIVSVSVSIDSFFTLCQNCLAKKAADKRNFEDNDKALQTELKKLIEARNDLMTRVKNAETILMERTEQVNGWLSRVQTAEAEVGELKVESREVDQRLCLGGSCSKSCKSSYRIEKRVANLLDLVITLKHEGNDIRELVKKVADDQIVVGRPSEPTIVGLQSTFDEVWSCLKEKEGRIIGLYGMGGVGKTTLLTQINNKFLDTPNDFDVVIWVVVSRDMQLEGVQENIAKRIGLFNELWKCRKLDEKASDIFKILSKKNFVLLLDDIWERVDLTRVGIPLPCSNMSSKVVFTTRFVEVCGLMEAHKKFRLNCLTHKKAWKLFQQKVGEEILESHPAIRELAETVTKKCGGLPLALVTIGRAMACKETPEEWNYAIEVLRNSASEFPGMGREVYPLLKFSYDSLPNEIIKSCLLYCSLFPENYSIHKRVLIECWIGEGFLEEKTKSGAQNHGYYIIGVLLQACLLEEDNEHQVKMHDVVRDMVLWIASENKEKYNFLVHASEQLTEAPEIEKWEGVRRMSLMNNQIEELSAAPFCPHLLTLFLNHNHLKMITNSFFEFMPSLKVLSLSHNQSLTRLPLGISKLVSLRHLDLSWSAIEVLPIELKALINLKCLILENMDDLHTVPPQLISSFSRLCVLRMFNYDSSVLFGDSESLVQELLCLKHLNLLSITLSSSHGLQRYLSSLKLQHSTRVLCLKYLEDSKSLNVLSLADLLDLKVLMISDCENLEELGFEYPRGVREPHGFRSLVEIYISGCLKLRDLTWLVFASNLKCIVISHCFEIEEIVSVGKQNRVPQTIANLNPFAKLEFLSLRYLQKL